MIDTVVDGGGDDWNEVSVVNKEVNEGERVCVVHGGETIYHRRDRAMTVYGEEYEEEATYSKTLNHFNILYRSLFLFFYKSLGI